MHIETLQFLPIVFFLLDPSTDNTVRDLRENLRHVITSQRRGKSEWTGGQDAIALLALQVMFGFYLSVNCYLVVTRVLIYIILTRLMFVITVDCNSNN